MNRTEFRTPALSSGIRAGILAAVLGLLAGFAFAATPQFEFPDYTPAWQKALEPVRAMPVQDFGFVRSGYTFSENHLMAIAGKRSLHGMDPTWVILNLMANPELERSTPLIKVLHPELAKIFGGGHISLETYRNRDNFNRMLGLRQTNQEKFQNPVNELEYKARTLEELESDFAILPREDVWLSPVEAESHSEELQPSDQEILQAWSRLKEALQANDAEAGAEAAQALADSIAKSASQKEIALPNLSLDVFYHDHQPFGKAAVWYLFSALVYAAAWAFGRPKLAWGGYALLVVGFIEQCIGVAARWILSGRAPLSNMFESFTFAIAGMVLVALIFELFNRTRLVGMGSAVLGFIFMVLAHKAPIFDSQIRPLMPALQSSWLTYHVVTIMLSYSAFALSFFVAIMYLGKDFLTHGDDTTHPLLRRLPSLEALDMFNYRIIGVGFPLLTLGIVFGAVWAATAWGRPWGFDPKETWSAITWLIYAIYLHVRYLAGWKGRRAAIFAIIGFMSVLFTYLGVNYLLPGLHSYA
jgi:cytochrome c-type biogenesis protein CcsB